MQDGARLETGVATREAEVILLRVRQAPQALRRFGDTRQDVLLGDNVAECPERVQRCVGLAQRARLQRHLELLHGVSHVVVADGHVGVPAADLTG